MAIEAERKFILADHLWLLTPEHSVDWLLEYIEQGYLAEADNAVVRVRTVCDTEDKYGVLTVKSKLSELHCYEFETTIPYEEAQELLGLCKMTLRKLRWEYNGVDRSEVNWTVDVFMDSPFTGVVIAEAETGDVSTVPAELPDFIDTKQIANDKIMSNYEMAKKILERQAF